MKPVPLVVVAEVVAVVARDPDPFDAQGRALCLAFFRLTMIKANYGQNPSSEQVQNVPYENQFRPSVDEKMWNGVTWLD